MGIPMLISKHTKRHNPTGKEADMAGDHPSKNRWERENIVQITVKINRNQDPELYELLTKADSKSGTVRELLRAGLTTLNQEK